MHISSINSQPHQSLTLSNQYGYACILLYQIDTDINICEPVIVGTVDVSAEAKVRYFHSEILSDLLQNNIFGKITL